MQDNTVTDPNPDNTEVKEAPAVAADVLIPSTPVPIVATPATPAVAEATEYEPTGDVGLDMALAFVGKAGIASNHPAMVAAQAGDFSILKATLAAKGTPGWEQFVALGEASYKRTSEATIAKQAKDQAAVFELAGGKEQWSAVQQWAGANATPEEKTEINALLSQGGLAAKSAVQYLLSAYAKAGNVSEEPRDVVGNAGRSGVATNTGPLSPSEYATAVGQLNHKLNGRLEGSKEYEALQRRRTSWRG